MQKPSARATPLQGLVKLSSADGTISLLATHISASSPEGAGEPITYANDLDVAADGTVYFTSCTDIVPPLNAAGFWDTYAAWFASLMQVRAWAVVCIAGVAALVLQLTRAWLLPPLAPACCAGAAARAAAALQPDPARDDGGGVGLLLRQRRGSVSGG